MLERVHFRWSFVVFVFACTHGVRGSSQDAPAQLTIDVGVHHQTIDGFGTTGPSKGGELAWLRTLYFEDLGASILRVDLTPAFK
jgi:O-glycosyl hydrolase